MFGRLTGTTGALGGGSTARLSNLESFSLNAWSNSISCGNAATEETAASRVRAWAFTMIAVVDVRCEMVGE